MTDAELLNWVLSYRPLIKTTDDAEWFWIEWEQGGKINRSLRYTNGRSALKNAMALSSGLPKSFHGKTQRLALSLDEGLTTNPGLLSAILAKSRGALSQSEVQSQRMSWCFGQTGVDKAMIERVLSADSCPLPITPDLPSY